MLHILIAYLAETSLIKKAIAITFRFLFPNGLPPIEIAAFIQLRIGGPARR